MKKVVSWGLAAAFEITAGAAAWATNGHVLHGVGSTNQAMGGAGIATGIDAIGSLHNNTSSMVLLDDHVIEFGFELFIPERSMYAAAGGAAGTVESETREAVIPSMGLIHDFDGPWSFGFSALGIAGFGVDYPANAPNGSGSFNPLAVPQSSQGFGAVYSNYQFMQLTAGWAYEASPRLSYGFGLNLDWASLAIAPFPAVAPNASGYPDATRAATAWGQGFTLSATYQASPALSWGAVLKSPQYFDEFEWNSQYPDGTPTRFKFRLDYPMILGAGLSYRPDDTLTLAADLRWINYRDTRGFEQKNYAVDGGPYVQGFGWEDIMVVSLGAQYRLSPAMVLRVGYNYGENPIPEEQQMFNVFAPAIVQHHVSLGTGYRFTSELELSLAYYHALAEEVSGAMISNGAGSPLNQPLPGTTVTNTLSEDSVSMQLSLKF